MVSVMHTHFVDLDEEYNLFNLFGEKTNHKRPNQYLRRLDLLSGKLFHKTELTM